MASGTIYRPHNQKGGGGSYSGLITSVPLFFFGHFFSFGLRATGIVPDTFSLGLHSGFLLGSLLAPGVSYRRGEGVTCRARHYSRQGEGICSR